MLVTEVRFEVLRDGSVGFGEILLQKACEELLVACSLVKRRAYVPVFS